MECGVTCPLRLLTVASHRESEGNARGVSPKASCVGWRQNRAQWGGASNHSQLFLLDNSVYKVQTVPDILQMPHNGSN